MQIELEQDWPKFLAFVLYNDNVDLDVRPSIRTEYLPGNKQDSL